MEREQSLSQNTEVLRVAEGGVCLEAGIQEESCGGRGPRPRGQSWGEGATHFLWKSGMLKRTWTTELR